MAVLQSSDYFYSITTSDNNPYPGGVKLVLQKKGDSAQLLKEINTQVMIFLNIDCFRYNSEDHSLAALSYMSTENFKVTLSISKMIVTTRWEVKFFLFRMDHPKKKNYMHLLLILFQYQSEKRIKTSPACTTHNNAWKSNSTYHPLFTFHTSY